MKEIEEVPGYRIYVLERERGKVKVGVSNRPRKRMLHLACQGGFEIKRTYESPIYGRTTIYELERIIHNKLSRYRFIGEWFKCGFDNAVKVVELTGAERRPEKIQPTINPNDEIAFEIEDGVSRYYQDWND